MRGNYYVTERLRTEAEKIFETKEDFIKTLFYILYLRSKKITVRLEQLQPVKDSEIYSNYKKNLCLSEKVKFSFLPDLKFMPRECVNLIKDNPEIFHSYYHYNFKNLDKILTLYTTHH
jgi:hypothetical protein